MVISFKEPKQKGLPPEVADERLTRRAGEPETTDAIGAFAPMQNMDMEEPP